MGREEIYSYTHSWIRKFDKSYHLKVKDKSDIDCIKIKIIS